VTYGVLIRQFKASEPLLLPAIQALRSDINDYAARIEAMGRSTQATLDDLTAALVAAGSAAEVMSYLQSRIADWDVSVWHPDQQAQSAVERRLRVRTTGRKPSAGDQVMTAEEALAGQRMLVVLGGPGSGKTWLARRYAREAAQRALSQLEDGASLDEVELPLLTTWDQWTKAPGSTRQSLVAASFASGLGHSDPEGSDSIGRLQRTFIHPGTPVLMVVDSLDEAADLAGQATRLRELSSLHGWRVVVTSRPAAWDATYRGEPGQSDGPRVVDLQDLEYPADVNAFIQAWFAANLSRGDALIQQISARDDLARVAVVPLMLTFYCLLTEEPAAADRPLPARRRDLYRRLVRRLLLGRWSANAPGPDAAPDLEYCENLLTKWAWHGVQHRTTPTGLGDWGDSFIQPTPPRDAERRAIDHVAPKVTKDEEGEITRRFVHRTFLEHFVAEHIAALDANEAAHLLLPHLWFDPDWHVAAPAAIVAHNKRQRGALLQQLLDQALQPAADPARQAANGECDRLLVTLAQESEPDAWAPEHQDLLHQCRERNAASHPEWVARSAHWTLSNQRARTALLNVLPTADVWDVGGLVGALLVLDPTDGERAEARTALLTLLPTAHLWDVRHLVGALLALVTTDAERAEARTALLTLLPTADPDAVGDLVGALLALVTTDAERTEARTALLTLLPTADPGAVGDLVGALLALVTTDAERIEARTALLNALPAIDPGTVRELLTALLAQVTTDAERTEARSALLKVLPTATDPRTVGHLLTALLPLVTTDAERTEARSALLKVLPTADPGVVGPLVSALRFVSPLQSWLAWLTNSVS
jgi:hypothetical protein